MGAPMVKQVSAKEGLTRLLIDTEIGVRVPAVLQMPEGKTKPPVVMVVHGRGKVAAEATVEDWRKRGYAVLAVDPRGWGESAPVNGLLGLLAQG